MTLNKPQGLPVTGMGTDKERLVGRRWLDGALATCPLPLLRETRGADVAFCAAAAEPGPGAWTPGAPGCASTWKVSADCGGAFILHPLHMKVLCRYLAHGRPSGIGITLRAFGSELSGGHRKGLMVCYLGGLACNPV